MSITENVFKHTHTQSVLIECKRVWVAFTGIHLKGYTWPLFLLTGTHYHCGSIDPMCSIKPHLSCPNDSVYGKIVTNEFIHFSIKRRTKFRHLAFYASIVFISFISLQSGNDDDAFFFFFAICVFFFRSFASSSFLFFSICFTVKSLNENQRGIFGKRYI